MLYEIAAILVGLIILVWSADRFVLGASATALNLGLSKLMVGLTIVSIGTSAPEIFVSAIATLNEAGNLAIGNALGSNIANIGLVLGATALVSAIPIQKRFLRSDLPILIGVSLIAGVTLFDLTLSLLDAIVLIATLVACLFWMFKKSKDSDDDPLEDAEGADQLSGLQSAIWLIVGLVALVASSKMLVWGASGVASAFGISDLIIGLTIVAIGTSLPELAASIMSAIKGHHDIAIGNVIGSNLFNLLAVMPIPGLLATTAVEPLALSRDYVIMMVLTVMLLGACWIGRTSNTIGRAMGAVFLASYVGYLLLLFRMSA